MVRARSKQPQKAKVPQEGNLKRPPEDGTRHRRRAILQLQETAGNQLVNEILHGKQIEGEHAEEHPSRELSSLGKPLDNQTRTRMEDAFGRDFRQVSVHTDSEAADESQAQNAQAFTVGQDIFFGQNQYVPHTNAGQDLLAHELAHVVQQAGSPSLRSHDGLESQADQAARAVSSGQAVRVSPVGAVGIQRRGPAHSEDKRRKKSSGETEDEKKQRKDSSPGFFSSLWSGLQRAGKSAWSGLKSAGSAIWSGMKSVGSAVWSGLQTAGNWIVRGAEHAWSAAQWVGRSLWSKIEGAFERLGRWVEKLPSRVRRLYSGLLEGLLSLRPWSLDWWKSLVKVDTWLDLLKWLGTRAIDLLEILGLGEIYETLMDFIKFNTRPLTSNEVSKASRVFGASIDYKLVRIDERAVIGPSFSHREYTSFQTINGWGGMTDDTLMHELVHVWQYEQSGAIYMPQAIHAQVWGAGYNYGGVAGLTAAKTAGQGILSFNREQQAQIVTNFYRIKYGKTPDPGEGTLADLPLYAHFVKDLSTLTIAQLLAK